MNQGEKQYKVPKNKCQVCYEAVGRYILDCYCIFCQKCYSAKKDNSSVCQLCNRPTKGNYIDAKDEASISKISHLFGNVESGFSRNVEVLKFQQNIVNRYCQHLEKKVNAYENAVNELVAQNPGLKDYFRKKLKTRDNLTQKHQLPNKPTYMPYNNSTIKNLNNKERTQSVSSIRSGNSISESNQTFDMHQIRRIKDIPKNLSGNSIYKVPNLNYNTAMRSGKRPNNMQTEDYNLYNRQNRNK